MYEWNDACVSIIIPVYKVEKYLARCLDSVLRQTHSNLDVIVVDDGSPDDCGRIASKYAERDSRIRVVRQINQGLSAARNTGLDLVRGEWIYFLDGDDMLADHAIEQLIGVAEKYRVRMSMCTFYWWYGGDHVQQSVHIPNACIRDRERLQRFFLTKGKNLSYVCMKLYHREVFEELRYPVGKVYEDIYMQARIVDEAGGCAMIDEPLYYYFQRPDSITNEKNVGKLFQSIEGELFQKSYIEQYHPELTPYARDALLQFCCLVLGQVWGERWNRRNRRNRRKRENRGSMGADRGVRRTRDEEYSRYWTRTVAVFRENRPGAALSDNYLRTASVMFRISPSLLGLVCYLYSSFKRGQ